MRSNKKEQIIDNYAKDIKRYLCIGLCEGQANGSFGEDLMNHFDIMVNNFKEVIKIEEELGIDLITLFKALKNGVYMNTKTFDFVKDEHPKLIHYKFGWRLLVYGSIFQLNSYKKYWALTKEELL